MVRNRQEPIENQIPHANSRKGVWAARTKQIIEATQEHHDNACGRQNDITHTLHTPFFYTHGTACPEGDTLSRREETELKPRRGLFQFHILFYIHNYNDAVVNSIIFLPPTLSKDSPLNSANCAIIEPGNLTVALRCSDPG